MDLSDGLTSWLEETVRAHGVETIRHGRSLLIGPRALRCEGEFFDKGTALQLDVRVDWEDGRVLVESCMGWGDTPLERGQGATRAFALNALHPILEAMCDHTCGEQVEQETVQVSDRAFTMYCGSLNRWGNADPPPNPEWFAALRQALEREPLQGDLHWVRLYVGRIPGEEPIREALLDNQPWPGGLAAVDLLTPPPSDVYVAHRFFAILRDTSVSRDRDEVDVLRTIRDLSWAGRGEEQEDIERRLQRRGISAERARALVVLVPEALANHALGSFWTTPPDEYLRDGVRRARLDDEPIYATALRMAPDLYADGSWRGMAEFAMHLSRSAGHALEARERGQSEAEPPLLALHVSLHAPERPIVLDFGHAQPPPDPPPAPQPPAPERTPTAPSVWARLTRLLRGG